MPVSVNSILKGGGNSLVFFFFFLILLCLGILSQWQQGSIGIDSVAGELFTWFVSLVWMMFQQKLLPFLFECRHTDHGSSGQGIEEQGVLDLLLSVALAIGCVGHGLDSNWLKKKEHQQHSEELHYLDQAK